MDNNVEYYMKCINIDQKPVRNYFDELICHRNWADHEPFKLREASIVNGLVNSIRHTAFNYDDMLKHIGKVKINYYRFKNATLEQIGQTYPFLKKECNKQKRKVNMVKVIKHRR